MKIFWQDWGLTLLGTGILALNTLLSVSGNAIPILNFVAFTCLLGEIAIQHFMITNTRKARPLLFNDEINGFGSDIFDVVLVTDGDIAHGSTGDEIEVKYEFASRFDVIPQEPMKYLWVEVYNRPQDSINGMAAMNVSALVCFEGKKPFYGRRATRLPNPFTTDVPLKTSIDPNGPPARLKIALKSEGEGAFYGWSEISYKNAFWKHQDMLMKDQEYDVNIVFSADYMENKTFQFHVTNKEGEFSIKPR